MGNGPSSPPAPAVTHPQPVVTRGGALQTRLLRTSLLKTEPLASGPGDTRPPVSSSSAPGTAVAVHALPPSLEDSGGSLARTASPARRRGPRAAHPLWAVSRLREPERREVTCHSGAAGESASRSAQVAAAGGGASRAASAPQTA